MTELVTVEQADAFFRALIWVGPLVGVIIGLIAGYLRSRPLVGLGQGLAVGLLGPVLFGMWSLYSHTVRFDPETGVAGLHRVSVHALNALIFIAVGVVLGVIFRLLIFPDTGGREDVAADEAGRDAVVEEDVCEAESDRQ